MAIPGHEAMFSMPGGMHGVMPPMPTDAGFMPGMPSMPGVDAASVATIAQMQQFYQYAMQQSLGLTAPTVPPFLPGVPAPYAAPPSADPAIAVSVEGMKFQYQLTEDDLHKVFSRYGAVKHIRVDDAGASAVITFVMLQDAQAAINDLNGKVLNGLDGTLRITWLSQGTGAFSTPLYPWGFPPASMPPTLPAGTHPGAPAVVAGGIAPTAGGAEKSPPGRGVKKYTCRFIIGIENDKEFQVARRIIGAKGANMKRIVKMTEAKLRLRGIGSGYFEGAGQKESQEPLQLCISCQSTEGYKTAVAQVEELLRRVYEEYRTYCRDNGNPVPDLQIQLSENQLIYSSSNRTQTSAGVGMGGAGGGPGASASHEAAGGGSPRRGRGRRSRGRGEARTASGEVDRGEPGPNAPSVEEIERLVDERNEARRANNFPEADRIRELLHGRGVALMDEPGGRGRGAEVTSWRYWRD